MKNSRHLVRSVTRVRCRPAVLLPPHAHTCHVALTHKVKYFGPTKVESKYGVATGSSGLVFAKTDNPDTGRSCKECNMFFKPSAHVVWVQVNGEGKARRGPFCSSCSNDIGRKNSEGEAAPISGCSEAVDSDELMEDIEAAVKAAKQTPEWTALRVGACGLERKLPCRKLYFQDGLCT